MREQDEPRIELACCESVLLHEIADKRMRRRDVAKTYALALRSSEVETLDWAKVNTAIIDRWSLHALKWIKEQAWSGACFVDVAPNPPFAGYDGGGTDDRQTP